jgi:hypothetical protein
MLMRSLALEETAMSVYVLNRGLIDINVLSSMFMQSVILCPNDGYGRLSWRNVIIEGIVRGVSLEILMWWLKVTSGEVCMVNPPRVKW